jgi:quercetin dioxygenase-like cupin family protein
METIVKLPLILALIFFAGHAEGAEKQAVAVKELVRSSRSWDGNPLPAYPQGQPEVSILRISIPPGAQLPVHRHPVINAGVLIHGELTVVTKDDKVLELKAGDPIVEVVETWHYGRNDGTEPADIIVFYAGSPGMELSVKK